MTARILILAAIALTLAGRAGAELPLALRDGEKLTFRVSWAIVMGAGQIKIAAQEVPEPSGPRLIVTSNTSTRGFARMLLHFDAEATSTFDLRTGRLLSLHEKSVVRSKQSEHTVTFDYGSRQALYTPKSNPEKARTLPFPDGDPTDLIMALLQTRNWNLKPGEKRDALVLFDDDFYELTIHALRFENVKTPLGTFNTLVLQPRMDKTPPKGMFKKGSTVHVWIAQDDRRLPVKFEVEFKIGTGTALLEAHEPPPGRSAVEGPVPTPTGPASSTNPSRE